MSTLCLDMAIVGLSIMSSPNILPLIGRKSSRDTCLTPVRRAG